MNLLELAVDIHNAKQNVEGFRRAAERLLDQAKEEEDRLNDLQDLWSLMREADQELDYPKKKRKAPHCPKRST